MPGHQNSLLAYQGRLITLRITRSPSLRTIIPLHHIPVIPKSGLQSCSCDDEFHGISWLDFQHIGGGCPVQVSATAADGVRGVGGVGRKGPAAVAAALWIADFFEWRGVVTESELD
jgi:hypothetical protein